HWRQTPAFKNLILREVPETSTRLALLKTGDVDIIDLDLLSVREALQAGLNVRNFPNMQVVFMLLFGQIKPDRPEYDATVPWALSDEARAMKVWQALNLAVDKQTIIDTLLQGYGVPAQSPFFFPGDEGYDPNWPVPAYDPEKAKQLLAEAGYPDGFTAKMWLTRRVGVPAPELGQAVALYWMDIGVNVDMEMLEWITVRGIMPSRDVAGIIMPYPLPDVGPMTLLGLFATSSGRYGWIEDDAMDNLMKKAGAASDPVEREQTLRNIGTTFVEGYNFVPIAYVPTLYGTSERVGEWQTNMNTFSPTYFEYVTPAK
ncbi:MAG: ABC transporter substrate-binding protein, partial [Dehalococcoidia bacterium]